MDAQLLFRGILFLLLPTPAPAPCYTAEPPECQENLEFLPGVRLAARGVDVITLRLTDTFLVDTDRFLWPNGTCTLCINSLQKAVRQRLPLAFTHWRSLGSYCRRHVIKGKIMSSLWEVAQEAANSISNHWQKGLESPDPNHPFHVSVAGSRSLAANFSDEKSRQDQYSFMSTVMGCRLYSFRMVHKPPLHPNFKRALGNLPPHLNTSTETDYLMFIHNYGTHFIQSVELGGRVWALTALPTCRLALGGLTVDEVGDCLAAETQVSIGGLKSSSDEFKSCDKKRHRRKMTTSFQRAYRERHSEVVGGHQGTLRDLQFGNRAGPEQYSAWLASLPSSPGLIHYSLEALHFLVDVRDPRREALRHAVNKYMMDRSPWWDCSQPCPPGQQKSPHDRCQCECRGSDIITKDCCPRHRGMARVQVTIKRARGLYGDSTSATDAYVKVSVLNKMQRTDTKWNTDNPTWMTRLDFGYVLLIPLVRLKVQVWDEDGGWDKDDHLGSCEMYTLSGSHEKICKLNHGHLEFSYEVRCLPHLTGDTCAYYASQGSRVGLHGDNSEP